MPPRPPARFTGRAVAALYFIVAALTEARFQGDTIDYARHAAEFDLGAWELGHLCWAPLGQALARSIGSDPIEAGAVLAFVAVNLASGLACALLLFALLRRLDAPDGVAFATTAALLFSQALLNFLHSGCSYVPGLALLLLALYLAVGAARRDGPSWPLAFASGAALGAAVAIWFPYVLTAPAVVLIPLILVARDRARLCASAQIALGLALFAAAAFGGAALCLGITDLAGLRAWVASSSHGIETGGLARALFGLARSFIFMGEDGLLFKRFLLKDPYNPVSLADLLTLSLWKLLLFYLALVSLLVGLVRTPATRRALLLLAVGGGPVFAFGAYWQGGDMERYLPLYPFLAIALAALLSDDGGWRVTKAAPVAFFVAAVAVNGLAYSRWQVAAYRRELAGRVEGLSRRLPEGSVVLVVRDRLKLLPRDFLFDAEARALPIVEIATPGLASAPFWRRELAERALQAWEVGGEVWLSCRLFADAPHPAGTWAEGDDPRLRWADFPAFFRALETDEAVGGEDGLVRLSRHARNERALSEAQLTGGP